jgi:hypothetical protein
MSWFFTNINTGSDRKRASIAEIVACFSREKPMLGRLALLVTGDAVIGDQCVSEARDRTVAASQPFQDWLVEWAKAATILCATSRCAQAIRSCGATYKDQHCAHPEHLAEESDRERAGALNTILNADPCQVMAELDALSRAVLVLRVAIRASIQDCVLRLNVSRPIVLAAHCRAMTWLHSAASHPSESRSFSPVSNRPARRQK